MNEGRVENARVRRLIAVVLAVGALLVSACFRSVSEDCDSEGDCYANEVCVDGTCVVESSEDSGRDSGDVSEGDGDVNTDASGDGDASPDGDTGPVCDKEKTSECKMSLVDPCTPTAQTCASDSDCSLAYCEKCICN